MKSLINILNETVVSEVLSEGDVTPNIITRANLGFDKQVDVDHIGHEAGMEYGIVPDKGFKIFWKDWELNDEAFVEYGFEEPMEPTFICMQQAGVATNSKRMFGSKWNNFIDPCGTDWTEHNPHFNNPLSRDKFKKIGQKCKSDRGCPFGCFCHTKPGVSNINPFGGPKVHGINFKKKYGKTREEFKKEFREEAVIAKNKAIDWIIGYYSEDNPDVFNKLVPKIVKDSKNLKPSKGLEKLKKVIMEKLHKKLQHMKKHTYSLRLFFNPNNPDTIKATDAWGWVSDSEHKYRYNLNLFNFTNPTQESFREAIFNVTLHELGHLVDNILEKDLGVDIYPGGEHQDYYKTTAYKHEKLADDDQKNRGRYVTRKNELYARMFNFRHYFGVTSNLTAKEWAQLFMEKVNSGDIEWNPRFLNYKNDEGEPIPKPEWGLSSNGDKVYLELNKEFLKKVWPFWLTIWEEGKPVTYDDVWKIVKMLRYGGYPIPGIGAILTSFSFDPDKFEVDNKDPNKLWIVFDFKKIAEANRLYVSIDPDDLEDSNEMTALENLYDDLPKLS